MASVPRPASTRMAHNVAALYGREDDTLIAWQRTCAQVTEALRTHHADDRLGKALALAQGGAVEFESDGFAIVTSGTKLYHVQADGTCDCPDYQHRSAPCKHVLAVLIHTKAHELLAPSPSAANEPAPPTPTTPKRQARLRGSATTAPTPTSACFK